MHSGTWTAQSQETFSTTMGLVVGGWENVTATALANLFSGDQNSLDMLTTLISNGQLLEGKPENGPSTSQIHYPPLFDANLLQKNIIRTFYAYAIPQLWALAGDNPFVIDSGYPCGTVDPLGKYLSSDTMHATYACGGKNETNLYYLVAPIGSAGNNNDCNHGYCPDNFFSELPGISSLTGDEAVWGGLTRDKIIQG
jgi:hypothetical protein